MGAMDLDGIDPKPCCPRRRSRKRVAHPGETVPTQALRRVLMGFERKCRGRDCLLAVWIIKRKLRPSIPRHIRRGLAAGVGQLNRDWHVGPAADAFQYLSHQAA